SCTLQPSRHSEPSVIPTWTSYCAPAVVARLATLDVLSEALTSSLQASGVEPPTAQTASTVFTGTPLAATAVEMSTLPPVPTIRYQAVFSMPTLGSAAPCLHLDLLAGVVGSPPSVVKLVMATSTGVP